MESSDLAGGFIAAVPDETPRELVMAGEWRRRVSFWEAFYLVNRVLVSNEQK
jgi:hypothetical protein